MNTNRVRVITTVWTSDVSTIIPVASSKTNHFDAMKDALSWSLRKVCWRLIVPARLSLTLHDVIVCREG
jgi:hypothetical protein